MTAIIGVCLPDGAFLAADSRRTKHDTGQFETVQKISNLRPGMLVATGGLGTMAHSAREELINIVNASDMSLDDIIANAQAIFSAAYAQSFIEYGNHQIPLYCILAGKDDDGNGFICSLKSSVKFVPSWVKTAGLPYLTGSNTPLVTQLASNVFHELNATDSVYKLDKWSIESLSRICARDASVGFPVQLAQIGGSETIIFPVEKESYVERAEFETEFPTLPC